LKEHRDDERVFVLTKKNDRLLIKEKIRKTYRDVTFVVVIVSKLEVTLGTFSLAISTAVISREHVG